MDVINVGLYGGKSIFGGKESPLEASIVRCDKYENCSYYKSGLCLNVRAPLSNRCKHGTVNTEQGYTSRAAKYYDFKSRWQKHEKYNKLDYPPTKLGVISDEIVFPYPFVRISETGSIEDPNFSSRIAYIPREVFTADLIRKICAFHPRAMMGGEIRDYQVKTVPLFLAHLKEVLPLLYNEFVQGHAEYDGKVSYIGRTAILKTVSPSTVRYESNNYPKFDEQWTWDGEVLTRAAGYVHAFNITKDYEVLEIKIRPSDKSKIKISSNEQVNDGTVFVD